MALVLNVSPRLVLESGFAGARLAEALKRWEWPFLYSVPASEGAHATEHVWKMDWGHTFHLFECAAYPVEYCQVAGPFANDRHS